MRSVCLAAAFAGLLAIGSMAAPRSASAAEGLLAAFGGGSCGCEDCGGGCGDSCDNGCGKRHHFGHRHRRMEGADKMFNCGCNGSYKFPVPPLYTYHWPGLYSHQLMTDYHSPWRFPPVKPYAEETVIDGIESSANAEPLHIRLRSVSHEQEIGGGAELSAKAESMSDLMRRVYR